MRIFAHNAAIRARKAAPQQLQYEPDLPKDVVFALAWYLDDVAVPVLQFSRALSDADLAEFGESEGQAKRCAMATRHQVGPVLSDALIDHGDEKTVATLLANAGSCPSQIGMMNAFDNFTETAIGRRPTPKLCPLAILLKSL